MRRGRQIDSATVPRGAPPRETPSTQGFQFIGGNLALDFVNTVGDRLGRPRDYFVTVAEFVRWAQLAGLGESLPLRLKATQLAAIRKTRETLYRLLKPAGAPKTDRDLAPLNALLVRVARKRRLARVEGRVLWKWDTSARDPDRILAEVLLSAADLLTAGLSPRVSQCDDASCGWLFLDHSQVRRRRWCRMADCGNRAKARRHYRKTRALAKP